MSFINYLIVLVFTSTYGIQEWKVRPRDDEVNPGDNTTLFCGFRNIAGDCRWEKDGTPVGMFPGKYSWAGNLTDGDCSINIYHVEREFDHGGWQCSVTATSFRSKDALGIKKYQII
ncbi:uncharacterized protein LOC111715689 [Eurytemora carolleeae]|uniref:uncharacterized protein LOC111715689 n=1 Tax=Eurytemora carolleeae TaxID=1294199 RepID=UPI000C75BD13|nr:uncharacterized protein LOC111715689 [Eurytemora carolleeae]|eukprot:XP_023346818.1 uncharacterized protein LOC111715689 [Eurytemora affinis]